MKKIYIIALAFATQINAFAQTPTIVNPVSGCSVIANFNTTDEGFSSPSIYSSDDNVSFYRDTTLGALKESSGLNSRSGSIISPIYIAPTSGQATVGFRYEAPLGTEYRVRIISAAINPPLEILGTTANGPVYTVLPSDSGSICLLLTDADITAGRGIRFEFTFRVNGHPNEVVIFDDFANGIAAGPTPVTFEGFVARKTSDGSVKLLWNVGNEINVKGYNVETSVDGIFFTNAGYVPATGSRVYTFDNGQKLTQTVFYRVKNVDFDGRTKATPIIKVFTKEIKTADIQVYPMPATNLITVQHGKAESGAVIYLYNAEGKMVRQKSALANSLQTQIYLDDLNKGMYFIKYDDGQGGVKNVKIVKN